MKTGKELLDSMPDLVRDKVLKNVRNLRPEKYNNMFSKEYINLNEFITCIFSWGETPEGGQFWCEVSDGRFNNLNLYENH